jgi:crotonobetainyl-CoA:carnitine CoA-transferase CaiB-like acyl-CoA transferase
VGNDTQFARCGAVLGHAEWADHERFSTNPQRVAHRQRLVAMMDEAFRTRGTDECVPTMEAAVRERLGS